MTNYRAIAADWVVNRASNFLKQVSVWSLPELADWGQELLNIEARNLHCTHIDSHPLLNPPKSVP
ncbi:hypothetical protein [Phormidesmis sp. 146-20]